MMNAMADIRMTGASGVDLQSFRNAMSKLGAAVSIVTTDGPGGRAGFTASAVCSVTDSPPTLLVCVNRNASAYPNVIANNVLCVNALASGHEALSGLFGGKTPQDERFAAATWLEMVTGAPVLEDCAVSFDCRISEVVSVSTHDILICRIEKIYTNGATHGLVYFDRRYHALETATPKGSS